MIVPPGENANVRTRATCSSPRRSTRKDCQVVVVRVDLLDTAACGAARGCSRRRSHRSVLPAARLQNVRRVERALGRAPVILVDGAVGIPSSSRSPTDRWACSRPSLVLTRLVKDDADEAQVRRLAPVLGHPRDLQEDDDALHVGLARRASPRRDQRASLATRSRSTSATGARAGCARR